MSDTTRDRNVAAAPPATQTTSGARRRFAGLYGAKPWHLLSLLGCFLVTGYTVTRLFSDQTALVRIAIWFVGAAVVWDAVLGPALAAADAGARPVLRRVRVRGVSPLNHVRFPALLSFLLLVTFTPVIFQRSEFVYRGKSGLTQEPYLERWLLVTLALFTVSALLYAARVLRAPRTPDPGASASS